MTKIDDLRSTLETTFGLSPAKAQRLAKGVLEPGAAKEQVGKATAEVIEWSQRNRERLLEMLRREVDRQIRAFGAATQADVDALTKRVRALERAASATGGRKKSTAKKPTARKPAARKQTAQKAAPVEGSPAADGAA